MRIISKFKDYYDNVASSFGYDAIDPKLVYVRETKEEKLKYEDLEKRQLYWQLLGSVGKDFSTGDKIWEKNYKPESNPYLNIEIDLKVIPIGFCGKLYFGYKTDIRCFNFLDIKLMYNFDDICNYFKKDGRFVYDLRSKLKTEGNFALNKIEEVSEKYQIAIEKKINQLIKESYHTKYSKYSTSMSNSIERLENSNGKTISDEMFISSNSPIILAYKKHGNLIVEINPNLSKYNFASKIDPFTAFQEISMYIGNNLAKQVDPTVNFTDEMKRDIAGFDEWSFKKAGKNSKL